ncbi:MAG: hypothetical protein ACUVUC_07115 [Thermoguttaceae bacterium]
MRLSRREKLLAVAAGVLVLGFAGRGLAVLLTRPISDRLARIATLQKELLDKQERADAAARAQAKMQEWCRVALPSDVRVAKSVYQTWLLDLAVRKKLRNLTVDPGATHERRGVFSRFTYTVHGLGSLERLVEFLYDFYSAPHLHRITDLTIKPREKSSELDLTIVVEALSLPNADRRDKLAQGPANRLKVADLAVYQKAIAGRNPFAPYTEPRPPAPPPRPIERPPEPPKEPPFDISRFAYITGIFRVDGNPGLFLQTRTTGEMKTLYPGDSFHVGPLKGKIAEINDREVIVALEGHPEPVKVALGESLKKDSKNQNEPEEKARPASSGSSPQANQKPVGSAAAPPGPGMMGPMMFGPPGEFRGRFDKLSGRRGGFGSFRKRSNSEEGSRKN